MKQRVLLVGDDAVHQGVCTSALQGAGYEVERAAGFDEAMASARRRAPDVILSDVMMGDFDGFGLCRKVRGDATLRSIPVVLTADFAPDDGDWLLAGQVGANALVARADGVDGELAAVRQSLLEGAPLAHFEPMQAVSEHHLSRVARHLAGFQESARRSERRYRTLLDNAHDAIALIAKDGHVIEVNRRCAALFKVSAESLRGQHVSTFDAPHSAAFNREEFDRVLGATGGYTSTRPVAVKAGDGSILFLEFAGSVIDVGGDQIVMGIARDVTERVRTSEALAASELRYRTLVERLPEVLWSSTADGQITFISPNVQALTGLTADEVKALPANGWAARIHPEDLQKVVSAYDAFFGPGGARFDLKYRWKRPDGRTLWLHSRSSAKYDLAGVTHCDGLFSDITAQVQLEESLRQSQKMEAVGLLAAGVAHDFNNLLMVIMANAEFLGSEVTTDELRGSASEVHEAASRASALTRQLLLFSRKQAPHPEVLRPDAVVNNLCKMLRRLIGEDIVLTVDAPETIADVCIDRGQLEQLVVNLAVNARDAMPGGGALSIRLSNVTPPREALAAVLPPLPPGPYVAFEVRDTGTGIAPEIKGRIFEPFFTTKGAGRGTGLGLSTVFAIVQHCSGGIGLDSVVGQGTCFTVYLPRAVEPVDLAAPSAAAADVVPVTETVLLVEDDTQVGSVARRMLQTAGYHVWCAANAREAFAALDREPKIDLVLADVVMPGISGPHLVAALRKQRPALKALYMTGFSEHPLLESALLGNRELIIEKPVTTAVMLRRVREALSLP